ncbi:hypothetical protein DFR29_106218 [Tahibacter aquaticus]|uniref:Tetratricopeptide repeat protein n=1 Tax=Tahibacter aquaticus TaxID=520092 RepID=A0A4R6YYI4_9GAMM|nr:hypothetical protein [Tahibacter aquaticus]TDR44071.1 hypothetical protein DFR29_106218 [Tahibacter aquaticus]
MHTSRFAHGRTRLFAAFCRALPLLALALVAVPSSACGPDFPHELLSDRHASVYELVDGTFDFEVSRLLPGETAQFKPLENYWDAPGASRIELEKKQLGEAGYAQTEAMRLAADDAAAWAAGDGLSQEVRLYTAGARAFHAGDYAVARQRFEAVVALPPGAQSRRGLWARYMLARLALDEALGAGAEPAQADAAAQAFQAVRAAAKAGAEDREGLAVASFGEEARLHLNRGNLPAAAKLYAQQAAQGSASGRASLLFLARRLFANETELTAALSDPLLQQLLAAYVYTRSNELQIEQGGVMVASPLSERYYAAVEAAGSGSLAGVDRVAAAAYRAGRYELAAKLAPRSDSALAHWVRAKLALRKGDDKAAAEAYAQASRAFPREESWGISLGEDYAYESLRPACRVDGERAILALGRGDYAEALRLLHASKGQYWLDEAQVAERVLSVDELKQFVDREVPAPAAPPKVDENNWVAPNPDQQLRSLLARRLLRLQRYDEALAYFPAELRDKAAGYAQARQAGTRGGRIERAQNLFRAAALARESGMEILGTELGPDANVFGGNYELSGYDLAEQDKKLIGPDEGVRIAASAAQPDQRFHYRHIAADLASQAADQVPPRSQAFAALLCSATGWLINRDPAQAQGYYRRYLKQGAYVSWGGAFGSSACPAPDFDGAAKRLRVEQIRWAKQVARQAAPFVAAGLVAIGIGLVFWWRRRRAAAAVTSLRE